MLRTLWLCVSLLLGISVLCLWMRTIHTSDRISFISAADTNYTLSTHPHGLDLYIETNYYARRPEYDPVSSIQPEFGWSHGSFKWGPGVTGPLGIPWAPPKHYWFGFGEEQEEESWIVPASSRRIVQKWTLLSAPLWIFGLVLAIPSSLRARGWIRRRVRKWRNCCLECGYDLRATSGICPECGSMR
jgi:hypothetical protein